MKKLVLSSPSRGNVTIDTLLSRSKNWNRIPTYLQPLHNHIFAFVYREQCLVFCSVFKDCPHPDDKQRMRLSQELGLKTSQVKFWFQNRRTQMKAQQDRSENAILRAENESLKNDFYLLQAELSKLVCPNCNGPPVPGGVSFAEFLGTVLRHCFTIYGATNANNGCIDASFIRFGQLDMNIYLRQFPEPMAPVLTEAASFPDNDNIFLMEEEKATAMKLAMSSMDELVKMFRSNEPLWIRNKENGKELLNLEENAKVFHNHWPLNLKQHSSEFRRTEASRNSAVIMNSITWYTHSLCQQMDRALSLYSCWSQKYSIPGQLWIAILDSSNDTVRITTRKVIQPCQPNGLILCAVSTAWLSYPHHQVFDLLRDEKRIAQLEVLSNGNALHEVADIANGAHPGNCISLLRIDLAMSGEDPSCIPLLPLGFCIAPMELIKDAGSTEEANGHRSAGGLLTVGLQVLARTVPSAKLNLSSIATIDNHLRTIVHRIIAALSSSSRTLSCPDIENDAGSCSESANAPEDEKINWGSYCVYVEEVKSAPDEKIN
ncbi:homeobox-leucine zipper protein HDG5-like isoform X2 [Hibiscus syriacus]|uniref:Homeobox-leucine zipper protein HDG5-like isoform X2 n=1 Tax=Hibiscus syriacus TaxID=106335 RepID=A0A6A3CRA5_HIBSY|nr:homeobox-leucine zipper protein HDG5-like isoform X2 [Hibiscus syriacus]